LPEINSHLGINQYYDTKELTEMQLNS